MTAAKQKLYKDKAEECRVKAELCTSRLAREAYLGFAAAWDQMGENGDYIERLGNFTDNIKV